MHQPFAERQRSKSAAMRGWAAFVARCHLRFPIRRDRVALSDQMTADLIMQVGGDFTCYG